MASQFSCILAKYDQVDSPPSGILDGYADDDYYLSEKKPKKKSKGGKTPSSPSSGNNEHSNNRMHAKKFSAWSLMDTKINEEGNIFCIYMNLWLSFGNLNYSTCCNQIRLLQVVAIEGMARALCWTVMRVDYEPRNGLCAAKTTALLWLRS